MKIIIGLGNPGGDYQTTRHNVGFLVIDTLAKQLNADVFTFAKKLNAEIATARYNEKKIILVKPQTFMNSSGQTVAALLHFYKLLPKTLGLVRKKNADLSDRLVIVHDDIDITLGDFKMQTNRSAGGHNGVQSIIERLKTQNFTRVRVGVANSLLRKKITPKKFVMEKFSAAEKKILETVTHKVTAAIEKLLSGAF